jgi:hemerythrin
MEKWKPVITMGIDAVDKVHRDLLAQMHALLAGSDSDVAQGMERLVELMEHDFRDEEELMERIHYPAIRAHMEQHARVLGALHRIEPGDVPAARAALVLLPQWFEMHLATLDSALAEAVSAAGTRAAPPR